MPDGTTYNIKDTVARQSSGSGLTVNDIYPVGSIYMSVNSTDPGTLFAGTTWAPIQDTFLLSAGNTYSAGTSGGNSTHTHATGDHTLTARESGIRQHDHPDTFAIASGGGAHTHTANYRSVYSGGSNYSAITGTNGTATTTNAIASSGAHTHSITGSVGNATASAALDPHNHGDTDPASNMPPYLVVYMWERIS